MNKKIIAGVLVLLLGAALVYFRDPISRALTFGSPPSTGAPASGENARPVGLEYSGEGTPTVKIERITVPRYVGRDPAEVNPTPEEVRLFTEAQKQTIFAAIQSAGAEVKQNPALFQAWLTLGVRKKIIGDFVGARDAWEYASLLSPQSYVPFKNLGELHWHYLPDYPKAERNFRTAITNDPAEADAYISLSDLYYYSYQTKKELADDILLEGLAKNPGDINLMKKLAHLYEERGEYAKALEWWEKVLARDPGNQAVAETIGALKKKIEQ